LHCCWLNTIENQPRHLGLVGNHSPKRVSGTSHDPDMSRQLQLPDGHAFRINQESTDGTALVLVLKPEALIAPKPCVIRALLMFRARSVPPERPQSSPALTVFHLRRGLSDGIPLIDYSPEQLQAEVESLRLAS
jgi:hypothetical protein